MEELPGESRGKCTGCLRVMGTDRRGIRDGKAGSAAPAVLQEISEDDRKIDIQNIEWIFNRRTQDGLQKIRP